VSIVTFVHGWKHSAAFEDEDVQIVRRVLTGLAILNVNWAESNSLGELAPMSKTERKVAATSQLSSFCRSRSVRSRRYACDIVGTFQSI
jgi:hypothetical protein